MSFNTQELRDCCASLEKAEAAIGAAHSQELISLLSDAEAVETGAELIELYQPNVAVIDDSILLSVGTEYRASFCAIGAALARDSKGGVAWSAVRRLKMMELSKC